MFPAGRSGGEILLLELKNIKKSFGKGDSCVEVLRGISLSVEKGEFCVLLGPSGSGKSTLLNIIGGIDTADSGEILIGGEKMSTMKEKQLTRYRREHLGYIFQMYNLIPNLTVRENIEVGAYLGRDPLDVDEILHTLGLYEHRNKLPNQLSGGQQQRTSIGRAIVKNPDILLCDEPTGALDYNTSREINPNGASGTWWWLRSAYHYDSFYCVKPDGSWDYKDVNDEGSVIIGFCL